MRNMSFAMTIWQVIAEEKTVTRRFGWWFLNPGDRVRPVRKSQGLKKGKRVEPLLPAGRCIEIISTRSEPLNHITRADCVREGFPEMSPESFLAMLVRKYNCWAGEKINRIEFKYIDVGK